ncbi:MAG: hypothetical protein IJL72_06940 [Lachnospiraceae bacterium]|nr:hypothetical protein [Lachnospiraceae bacterium]
MISCTEFIPSYSELFSFIERKHGRKAVEDYWTFLFQPDKSPLAACVKKEGIRGCFTYWTGTLNEEAADFTMYLNEKAGWFMIDMHRCPSKGRLLDLKDSIGVDPYPRYCMHCDHYREAVATVGLDYIYNFIGTDQAACRLMVYDKTKFDGRIIADENTEIMDRKASQNEYFHRGFHHSLNRGIQYIADTFGEEEVFEYLEGFAKHVYGKLIEDVHARGFEALEEKIRDTYEKEHASEVLTITKSADRMDVAVSECPAVRFYHEQGAAVSPYLRYTTETVMKTVAEEAGLQFAMDAYDEETGRAAYHFTK